MARERELSLPVGDRSRALTQPEALLPGLGFDIWRPRVPPIIGALSTTGAAGERAGLQVGDEILTFDGQPVARLSGNWCNRVEPNPGRTVDAGGAPRRRGSRRAGHDRRRNARLAARSAGSASRRRISGFATGRTLRGHADAAEVRAAGGSRAGRGQDLGHLGVHAADRRSHRHRRRVAEGDFRADQYRGNNRFRCAAGLAHVPRARWR